MPELPAEAVKASLIMTADDMWADWNRGGKVVVQVVADDAAEAIVRALAAHAGVGSPVSCPSAAPESTQSPETTSVAPVYLPAPENPAETLSALRERMFRALAASLSSPRRGFADHLDAVLAVRDDELARALRIADYHATQHRQAADAIARVHQVCHTALATPDAPDRWAVAAQVRAALEGPEPQVGAGAVSEEQTGGQP
ncbi:hypothetical protein [Microbispora rosea]|uniref:hypothetical protein n=1 Tax=Microbispora rosea TaxID=58117 RepID=UPI0004C427B0|nr:hypothetical protein [Microbispora rosea]